MASTVPTLKLLSSIVRFLNKNKTRLSPFGNSLHYPEKTYFLDQKKSKQKTTLITNNVLSFPIKN